jgi:hypothetical protein
MRAAAAGFFRADLALRNLPPYRRGNLANASLINVYYMIVSESGNAAKD